MMCIHLNMCVQHSSSDEEQEGEWEHSKNRFIASSFKMSLLSFLIFWHARFDFHLFFLTHSLTRLHHVRYKCAAYEWKSENCVLYVNLNSSAFIFLSCGGISMGSRFVFCSVFIRGFTIKLIAFASSSFFSSLYQSLSRRYSIWEKNQRKLVINTYESDEVFFYSN